MSARIKFAARSEVGRVRTNNEDNLYCNGVFMTASARERPFFLSGVTETPCIFAVCDGMGGEDCGELASLTAIETISGHSQDILNNILTSAPDESVRAFADDANTKLRGIMKAQAIRMGTTLAMAVLGQESFTVYNIGDSRVFRVNDGRLLRVTDDHTVAEEKVRMGLLTPAKAETSKERHILTRCLGGLSGQAAPDINGPYTFADNTGGLICSDGLTDMLRFPEIAGIMKAAANPEEAVNNLVDFALCNGGHDNVTCIVFWVC